MLLPGTSTVNKIVTTTARILDLLPGQHGSHESSTLAGRVRIINRSTDPSLPSSLLTSQLLARGRSNSPVRPGPGLPALLHLHRLDPGRLRQATVHDADDSADDDSL
jgi:hypothetical protein